MPLDRKFQGACAIYGIIANTTNPRLYRVGQVYDDLPLPQQLRYARDLDLDDRYHMFASEAADQTGLSPTR